MSAAPAPSPLDLRRRLGATPLEGDRCRFRVWAPHHEGLSVRLLGEVERIEPLSPAGDGYHEATIEGARTGANYLLRLPDGVDRPDPASRFQPEGPHGPSQIVELRFDWTDQAFTNPAMARHVIYELHVGTFTPEGTFEGIIPRLAALRDLGVTAIELMPVAQFPGTRNWGYDGVGLFAAQDSYGGPDGLRRLVNAAHGHGLAVFLDVVYNHLGPEGNYLHDFGPYFTDRYHTPWGKALNFDGPHADGVREFFIQNALSWCEDHHVDGLRLDAVHAIVDNSPLPFVEELVAALHDAGARLNRRILVMPESAANDARIIRSRDLGGFGADAQWNDDFHHALRTCLSGERAGYYASYGTAEHLARAFRRGYVYTGEFSPFHQRRHGRPTTGIGADRFIVFSQNHDQVGNRAEGDRPRALVDFEGRKAAAALTLLSPFVPMLFMGEEHDEPAPFQYFISHTDERLVEAVRKGRRAEFESFQWRGEIPDPQAEETFARSRIDWTLRERQPHSRMLALYRELLRLRREHPALTSLDREHLAAEVLDERGLLRIERWSAAPSARVCVLANLCAERLDGHLPAGGRWRRMLDTADAAWAGPGGLAPETPGDADTVPLGPREVALYECEER